MDNMGSRYSDRLGEPRPRTRLSRCIAAAKDKALVLQELFAKAIGI